VAVARNREVHGWERLIGLAGLLGLAFALDWAQAFFIPVALAMLLTFLLTPAVSGLERLGLGRVISIVVVVVLAFSILIGIGVATAFQFSSLLQNLPQYAQNVRKKVAEVGELINIEKFRRSIKEIEKGSSNVDARDDPAAVTAEGNEQVVVVKPRDGKGLTEIPLTLGNALERLAAAGMVIVLVVFMLIQREDILNRLIRLIGHGHLATTTKALEEGARRISRFLIMQSLVNGTFGLGVGLGLFIIGVPYALFWGLLAAVLRFIPYVGAWLTVFLAFGLSLAVFPGWTRPLVVIGLLAGLEILINSVMEPLLYSRSAGVSQVALLIAIAFWTWLWGPVGLLLATPITVCLVVLGRYVPQFGFLSVLLGDEPVMTPGALYYQRILAGDQDEAMEVVEEYLASHPAEKVYDDLLIPALALSRRDRRNLSYEDEHSIIQFTREVLEVVAARYHREPVHGADRTAEAPLFLVGCPARDEMEELGLHMLNQVLDPQRFTFEIVGGKTLSLEVLSIIEAKAPPAICICALPHGGFASGRYLVQRLRKRFPRLQILVGHWGLEEVFDRRREALISAGADHVAFELLETRRQLQHLAGSPEGTPAASTTAA
jgi:predicted PurR-regulated permease PerM